MTEFVPGDIDYTAILIILIGLTGYLLGFLFIIKKTQRVFSEKIERSIVITFARYLQEWRANSEVFASVLEDLQNIRSEVSTEIEAVLNDEVNRMHSMLMKSNQIYQDDLEKLHLAIDDLLVTTQTLAKNNDLIRKQQKEIQNWQRRAERIEGGYKNQ
jgi:hypothetical protein